MKYLLTAVSLIPTLFVARSVSAQRPEVDRPVYDVIVYGATSGGIIAAISTADSGKSVLLIEPGRHLGGLTAGGLGATDIGNKAAIGGLSRSFYRRVGEYYAQPDAWKFEKRGDYRSTRRSGSERELWTFEPHVAETIYREMLTEASVPVVFEERLDLQNGVRKEGTRISAIRTESGREFQAKMFIDATYEGDLMAHAGVSYHVGREANATYGETLNGVQTANARFHQFIVPVDPYRVPGDPASGLLPGVWSDGPGEEGAGDHRVQAYCFRMCTTDVAENRRAWEKPADYDPLRYELLLRNCEAGDHRKPWNPVFMPNRKTDTNNNFAISTDNIGMNYDYPDGDYATRDRIFQEHLSYQQGLMWTLAHHPRVPEKIRAHFQNLGLAKDEFTDHDNWPHQLYVREARRMVSDYVMTQHNCQGRTTVDDPVGLAAYTMDSHHVQRYVRDGKAWNEGDVEIGGFSPYPISYRSIRPRKSECSNLLVPVCLSASHIAYGSIRMEPVFMVLGQSAAIAACQAIDEQVAVQDIDMSRYQSQLKSEDQVLTWTGPKRTPPIDKSSLPGIVLDDTDATMTGNWLPSQSIAKFVGPHYLHDNNEGKGEKRILFRPSIPEDGHYEIRLAFTANGNRATNVPITIVSADGEKRVTLNQKKSTATAPFVSLGIFRFQKGTAGSVIVTNQGTDGYVVVDAIQLLPVDPVR